MADRPFIKSVYYYTAERKKQSSDPVHHESVQPNPPQTQRSIPPRVPEHYFAPKPISTKPLIESSYCVSAASVNYLMKSPNVMPFHYDAEIESEPTTPTTASSEMHYNQLHVFCQKCTGHSSVAAPHYGNQLNEASKEDAIKTAVTPRQIAEMSEYAWKRLDEEKKQQYAINLWHEGSRPICQPRLHFSSSDQTDQQRLQTNSSQ
ncbi:hypothetical protein OSTOST_08393 [Ostertagia ostertagi]